MKNATNYILLLLILTGVGILMFTGNKEKEKKLDERLSFAFKEKVPYGTYVAYEGLKHLFPASHVILNGNSPGNWDSLSMYESGQAILIVSPWFFADEFEMKKLIRFAENGNDVFISAAVISEDVKSVLGCRISYVDIFDVLPGRGESEDSLKVRLERPPFNDRKTFRYPGKKFDTYFVLFDTAITTVLGTGREVDTNFVHLKAGRGNVYIHLAPMAFTNYFLLKDDNIRYYENLMSVIPASARKIAWDQYFLMKRSSRGANISNEEKGWLSSLMSYREFRWAIWVILLTLLVYVLMEMRRKQRYIPLVTKPRNDSLDFVKTIGRLYFDKGDHRNLSRKMAAYFLEHLRNRYKMPTGELNDQFIRNLQFKTGLEEEELRRLIYFIRELETAPAVSEKQLIEFHRQLENFYNKT